MDWSTTKLTEPQVRAQSIHTSMGPLDGLKHILQIQYFCDSFPFDSLKKYWEEVEIEFQDIAYPKK